MAEKSLFKGIEKRIGVAQGTAVFMLSTILIKLIGGLYKIPLCNLLGSKGIGLYQMVFPVYSLLITVACGGLPTAITQIIASGYNAEYLLKKCVKIFCLIALFLSVTLIVFAKKIAYFQGDVSAYALYFAIAPSIILVTIISCLRGYFQGKSNFKPTALSQTIEQVVKVVSGVIALLFVKNSVVKGAFFACLAVTFSELIALFYLLVRYRKSKKNITKENTFKQLTVKQLLVVIAPISCAMLFFPLASFADSFIVVNALKNTYFERATEVYGVYAGGVDTVIALPVALLHNLSLGYLPQIVKGENKGERRWLLTVFLLSVSCALLIIAFSPLVVKILFSGLKGYDKLLTTLLRYASINVISLATLQATNCYLIAKGRQKVMLISMPIGVFIKIIANIILVKMPSINVFGMIISDFCCYFVALFINLLYIIYINKQKTKSNDKDGKLNENYSNRSWCNEKRTGAKCN